MQNVWHGSLLDLESNIMHFSFHEIIFPPNHIDPTYLSIIMYSSLCVFIVLILYHEREH